MEPTVRRMLDLTRDQLATIHAELTNSPERYDAGDNGLSAGSAFQGRIDDHLSGYSLFPKRCWGIFLSDHNERTMGWCMLTQHADPDLIVPTGSVGFYVHPNFRRLGVGKRLVQEAQEVARKNGMGRVLANPWNRASSSFFASCGFQTLQDYTGAWEPGIAFVDL